MLPIIFNFSKSNYSNLNQKLEFLFRIFVRFCKLYWNYKTSANQIINNFHFCISTLELTFRAKEQTQLWYSVKNIKKLISQYRINRKSATFIFLFISNIQLKWLTSNELMLKFFFSTQILAISIRFNWSCAKFRYTANVRQKKIAEKLRNLKSRTRND